METKVKLTLRLSSKSKKRDMFITSEYSRRRDAIRGLKRMLRSYEGKIVICWIVEHDTVTVYELKQIKGGSAVFTTISKGGESPSITRTYKFPSNLVEYEK